MDKVYIKYGLIVFITAILFFTSRNGEKNKTIEECYMENIASDPPTLDPHMCDDNVSWRVISDLFEGLVCYNQKNEIELCGAKKYDISDDGLTYKFYLRDNAKWSNGDKVTADDYIFAFQRAVTPATLAKYSTQMLDIVNAADIIKGDLSEKKLGVSKENDHTFVIKLKNKNKEFLHYLTLPTFFPLHRGTINKYGASWATNIKNVVSNGAYKGAEWVHNSHVKLEKNEHFWNTENVKIKNVRFLMINNTTDDMNKFSSGGEHMTYYRLPVNSLDWYKKKFGEEVVSYKQLSQERLIFNIKHKKLEDIRVRKALSMTVDRDRLVTSVFKNGIPSYCAILETIANDKFSKELDTIEEFAWVKLGFQDRVEKAKKLLEEVGYTKDSPLIIELAFPTGGNHKSVAEAIQTTWNNVFEGMVICTLLFEDWSIFLQNMKNGKYDICRCGWIADLDLPSNFSMLYTTGNSCNFSGYSNHEVDTLYAESLLQDTEEQYFLKQKEINKIIMCDYVAIPYASTENRRLVSKKIKGVDFSRNKLDRFSTKYFELAK